MPAHEPQELHQLFVNAVCAHDLDRLLDLYEAEAVAVDLAGQPMRGMTGLRQFLDGFLIAVRSIQGETRAVQIAGDLALLSSVWTADIISPDGHASRAHGALRLADGTWRFVIDDPLFGERVLANMTRDQKLHNNPHAHRVRSRAETVAKPHPGGKVPAQAIQEVHPGEA